MRNFVSRRLLVDPTTRILQRSNSPTVDMCRRRIWERNAFEALRQAEMFEQNQNPILDQTGTFENVNEVQDDLDIERDESVGLLEKLILVIFMLIFGSTFLFFYFQILWKITYVFLKFIFKI